MALNRSNSKHKRSVSYSGGILPSFLNSNTETKSEQGPAGSAVCSAASALPTGRVISAHHLLLRCNSNVLPQTLPDSKISTPISPVNSCTSHAPQFMFSLSSPQSTRQISNALHVIERGWYNWLLKLKFSF